MRRVLVHLVIVLTLAALAAPAGAHDHEPPPAARMKVDGETQKGRLAYSRWYTKSGGKCVVSEPALADTYPAALQVSRGDHVARVRLARRHRPAVVDIQTWHAGSSDGPTGPSEQPPHDLKPIRRDGRVVAYRVLFDITVIKDLFVKVAVVWPDREDCHPSGGDSQHAYWNFHLEAQV